MIKILALEKKASHYLLSTDFSTEKIKLTEDVVIKYILSKGKALTKEQYLSLLEDNNYYIILNKLISLLVKNMHSESEIKKYLYKYKVKSIDFNKYINRLKELKLIDDFAYAKEYVISKSNYSLDGPEKIRYALIGKKISNLYIDKAMAFYPLDQARKNLDHLLNGELKTNKQMPFKKYILLLKKRLMQKGYSYPMVEEMINNFYSELKNNCLEKKSLEVEYEKLKSSNQTNEKIKAKLYNAGYNIDLINEIIR